MGNIPYDCNSCNYIYSCDSCWNHASCLYNGRINENHTLLMKIKNFMGKILN